MLSDQALIRFRQTLHQHPELSDQEVATAARIKNLFAGFAPDETLENIGGNGLAFCFDGKESGPTTLIRCELDALPIQEINDLPYRSVCDGISHKCGHDGHMAIVTALGSYLAQNRPDKGRVICLFQPAEETGAGAVNVVRDSQFEQLKPDYCFALHNLPGKPLGTVYCKPGAFNCASRGMIIRLKGKTSHAAHPEDGVSPALAMSNIIQQLTQLPQQSQLQGQMTGFNLVTVVYAHLGEIAFGTAPGEATVMATLRTSTNEAMNQLIEQATELVQQQTDDHQLSFSLEWDDVFRASVNSDSGYQRVRNACQATGTPLVTPEEGFRWSEDFGIFTEVAEGAMFALGAGDNSPQLHNPDYDFPDELIPVGFKLFRAIVEEINQM
ncbi:amidohydrolase [Oceanospirillum sanctuarii]|uniref:amidohydrolase n=1 Tax=Oceanospirillum sanctuarii TaxID=1434821 RepID=UPI000A3B93C7|nr:amidohydrolase [Oceanospirillum sanctuarii]